MAHGRFRNRKRTSDILILVCIAERFGNLTTAINGEMLMFCVAQTVAMVYWPIAADRRVAQQIQSEILFVFIILFSIRSAGVGNVPESARIEAIPEGTLCVREPLSFMISLIIEIYDTLV
jgi:hypothetical protein